MIIAIDFNFFGKKSKMQNKEEQKIIDKNKRDKIQGNWSKEWLCKVAYIDQSTAFYKQMNVCICEH